MTKTRKGYDKIRSVFFRKAYVGLKSFSCITIFPGLVVSSVASGSGDPRFQTHAILKKKLYYNGENLSVIISLRCKLGHVFS